MDTVKEESTGIDGYQSIFTKLKKLHDIAKTNKDMSIEESQNNDNKFASKRKTDLDFDGLSDDSTLHSSTNKTKRRRFSDSENYSPSDFHLDNYRSTGKHERQYVLTLSNLPEKWTYHQIKHYVSEECGVNVLGMIDSRFQKSDYQLRLRFISKEQYKNVLKKLKAKGSEGKLNVKVEGESDAESDAESEHSDATVVLEKIEVKSVPPSCRSNVSEIGSEDVLFGLNPEFLKSLNIEPPLVKWINVTNFRCDKSELRDLFEMAGRVVICVVINAPNKYAKIMYSHPLEAVQAISLLNGQIFYGHSLSVSLDPMADSTLPLPKGLRNFGLGLGQMGKPLRDIVTEYDRFVNGAPSSINASLFSKSGHNTVDSELYSSSETSGSMGEFGAIGQKKMPTYQTQNKPPVSPEFQKHVPNQTSASYMEIKEEASSPMLLNPLANKLLSGMQSTVQCNNTSHQNVRPLNGPLLDRSKYINPNMPNFPRPNYVQRMPNFSGQYPPGSNHPPGSHFQRPSAPIFQGQPGPNFQGPPGPNFQGPPGSNIQISPNRGQIGQDNQGQFNGRNPQIPQNFRPQSFMQMGSIGPIPNNGPRMVPPVQNVGSSPVPPSNIHMPAGPTQIAPGLSNRSLPTVMVLKGKDPITLQVTNLPGGVTFASLCSKLSKVGQVVSLEFTTPGSAIVKFSNPSEAERCFQYFSPSRFGHELGVV